MADREGALRLKQALRVAMAEARIPTWNALAIEAKVSPTAPGSDPGLTGGGAPPEAQPDIPSERNGE